jgi:hypothetical protein
MVLKRNTPSSIPPQQERRWEIDPADNRLPGKPADERAEQRLYWAEQAHLRWKDPGFNLLRSGQLRGPGATSTNGRTTASVSTQTACGTTTIKATARSSWT